MRSQQQGIEEAARKAAIAQHRNKDDAAARYWHDWAMRAAELEDDPAAAKRAYRDAYRRESQHFIPQPRP